MQTQAVEDEGTRLFRGRFPTQTFAIGRILRTLSAGSLQWLMPMSSHTSPISQGSTFYDIHGLSEFKGAKCGGKVICFSMVRLPKMAIPKAQVIGTVLKFAALVRDEGLDMSLVVYKQLPLKEEGDTMVTEECTAAVTLSASIKLVAQFNTSKFVFYMDDGVNAVMTANIPMTSWSFAKRMHRRSLAALNEQEKYRQIMEIINRRRSEPRFLERALAELKRIVIRPSSKAAKKTKPAAAIEPEQPDEPLPESPLPESLPPDSPLPTLLDPAAFPECAGTLWEMAASNNKSGIFGDVLPSDFAFGDDILPLAEDAFMLHDDADEDYDVRK